MRAGVTIVVLAACRMRFDEGAVTTSDAAPDAFDPCAVEQMDFGPWGTPTEVPGVNASMSDDDPLPRADGLELIWGSNRPGTLGQADLWRVTRNSISEPWGPVESIAELNTTDNENTPGMSTDGLELFFSSNRPGSQSEDVWTTTRATLDSRWEPPVRVAELSSSVLDRGVHLWNNDLSLVMHSGRSGDDDLYVAHRATRTSPWSPPVPLGAPNTPGVEMRGHMSPCGLELTFQSSTHGTATEMQFFVVTRPSVDDPFGDERELTELNSADYDEDLYVMPSRRHAYFSTQREGGAGELYESVR